MESLAHIVQKYCTDRHCITYIYSSPFAKSHPHGYCCYMLSKLPPLLYLHQHVNWNFSAVLFLFFSFRDILNEIIINFLTNSSERTRQKALQYAFGHIAQLTLWLY